MVVARPQYVSARQETVQEADAASKPVAAPAVAVPRPGEKFSDDELHARFGVPKRGGIRVNEQKRCVVLVDLVDANSKYANTDDGNAVSYMGQDSDLDGVQNQKMSGNNLTLSRSRHDGYTVMYFVKERGELAFNSRVEYDSHDFVVEHNAGRQPRVVIKFMLRRIAAGSPNATTPSKMESCGSPWLAELEEDKLSTETVGEYVARMANNMDPGACTQEDAEEMDEDFRRLAQGEYTTLDDLCSEFGIKCTRSSC